MVDIVGIIPARLGSKRIPMKNIKDLNGSPLIAWTINTLKKSKVFGDEIYVSTEDFRMEELVHNLGVKSITRPKELANDYIHIDEAIIHAVNTLKKRGKEFEYVGIFQPTTPFRNYLHIREALEHIKSEGADSLFFATELKRFIWNKKPEPINYDYKNRPRSQDKNWELIETGDYIVKTDTLLKERNRLGGKITYYITTPLSVFDLDTKFDWKVAESIAKGFGLYGT